MLGKILNNFMKKMTAEWLGFYDFIKVHLLFSSSLPGYRVRHPCYSKKLFVRSILYHVISWLLCVSIISSWWAYPISHHFCEYSLWSLSSMSILCIILYFCYILYFYYIISVSRIWSSAHIMRYWFYFSTLYSCRFPVDQYDQAKRFCTS